MMRRTAIGSGTGVLLALALLAWVLTDPDGGDGPAGCGGLRATGWQPDERMTGEFARYGDDNLRSDDWTGGDGTRSVRLPDGRTLWLSADTFLDQVHPGARRVPQPSWVRNSALVMSPGGRMERTLLGEPGADGRPGALFPGTADADGGEVWRWPAQAVVEPRSPGSGEQVVRVLLWQREEGAPPWVFGVPRATEVATLSLPGLELESIDPLHRPDPATAPETRVLYGTSAVREGRWTYVFGADERGVRGGRASRAHVARAPEGRLADASAWRYWNGSGWAAEPGAAAAMDFGEHPDSATNTYSVARRGDSWLLLTMDAGGPDGKPSATAVTYWACDPAGPWHGPHRAAEPPLPPGGAEAGAMPYNPQWHAEFGGDGSLLAGYDVNVTQDTAAIQRDVALYRPRFLRLTLRAVP
ncbi:hypothetical protein LHJ74_14050 [Streptomyces sp. N2-109]|uniref:DUF4185 domain-containing protein n=1 Tax=Streptomyces gossypii TaxID=2883101 RepID=A0ABT2JU58_9ACTN|nr:hypothetical protein [Streptomyces gossypii]MCT2591019.1 hypothetical protein [Streptomyces gossypii]